MRIKLCFVCPCSCRTDSIRVPSSLQGLRPRDLAPGALPHQTQTIGHPERGRYVGGAGGSDASEREAWGDGNDEDGGLTSLIRGCVLGTPMRAPAASRPRRGQPEPTSLLDASCEDQSGMSRAVREDQAGRRELVLVLVVWAVIAVMLVFMCSARAREAASWSQRRFLTGGGGPPTLPLWEPSPAVRPPQDRGAAP